MKRNAYLLMWLASLCRSVGTTNGLPTNRQGRLAPRGWPATCRDLGLPAFQSEQAPLCWEPAGVPAQGAVRRDDPVARDHDGDRVSAECRPGGTGRLLVAGLPSDDLISGELAVRNPRGRGEDPLLERRERGEAGLHVERSAPPCEVLAALGQHAAAPPPVRLHA